MLRLCQFFVSDTYIDVTTKSPFFSLFNELLSIIDDQLDGLVQMTESSLTTMLQTLLHDSDTMAKQQHKRKVPQEVSFNLGFKTLSSVVGNGLSEFGDVIISHTSFDYPLGTAFANVQLVQ